jgi:hypothetical protein
MTGQQWRPLSVRETNGAEAYDGPHDGVPEWMFGALWDWITKRYPLTRVLMSGAYDDPAASDTYRRIQMALGLSLEQPGREALARRMQSTLHGIAVQRPAVLLDVADYWLAHDAAGERVAKRELDDLLRASRSVWTVTPGEPAYLARRVAAEVRDAAIALGDTGRPAEHLSRAWRALYGRNPNPSEGYREVVKAVEVAARPVVSPDNGRTTLGTIIHDMRTKPDKWTVGLKHHTPGGQVSAVVGMLDLLWSGQSDRHGDPDPAAPLEVTQDEAEAALHLALTLVHWFSRGVVMRA